MIHLNNFNISNYKSLVETEVQVASRLTALVGTNGAGKTNILSGILLLKKLVTEGNRLRRFRQEDLSLFSHSVVSYDFTVDQTPCTLKADIYLDRSEDGDPISYSKVSIKDMSKKANKWFEIAPEAFDFIEYYKERRNKLPPDSNLANKYLTNSKSINTALFSLSDYAPSISYYSATQFSDPTKSPISLELEGNKLSRAHSNKSRSHERFLYDLFIASVSKDNVAYNRYVNTVGKNGLKLIDNIQFAQHEIPSTSIKVQSGGHIKKISTNRTFVIPSFTVDELQLSPNQLSEGTFKTLALIFYILNDDTQLLLIEEPEVCVHHGLLGDVLDLIKIQSNTKQIIISTHSDYVLDKLTADDVVVVRKTGQGTKASPLTESMAPEDVEALKIYLNESGNLGDYWKESGYFND